MWPLSAEPAQVPAPIVARDGQRLARAQSVRFALVGGYAQAPPSLDEDLRRSSVDFVVLAGDAVPRGSRAAYRELARRLDGMPVCPLPGEGERRGDARLRRFRQAWDGLGVQGLQAEQTWRSFFLESGGHPWRVVVLDADRDALGPRFSDEQFWLPKVVSEGDEPLIVLFNAPFAPVGASDRASEGARLLQPALRRHVSGSRLALVAAAGGAPALVLPGGGWGEAWSSVGRAGGRPDTLRREASSSEGELSLEPGLDEALLRWFAARGAPMEPLMAGGDYEASRWPLLGWWLVTLDGPEMRLTLRLAEGEGWETAYETVWTRGGGWEVR